MNYENNFHEQPKPELMPLIKLPAMPKYSAWLTVRMLRYWVSSSKGRIAANGQQLPSNGFDRCMVRVGKHILIDIEKFDRWLNSYNDLILD